jgi:DNA polymerase-3 subunit gamma/tau
VLSRLQRFDFRPIARAEIAAKLEAILATEKRVAEPAAIELLARLADGGMRDAESMLDQLLSSGIDPLKAADVEELLGLPGADRIERLACAILDADAPAGLAILAEFEARGRDPRIVADRLTDLVRRGLHAALAGGGTVPGDAAKLPAGLDLSDGGGATIGLAGRTREALLGLANALRRIETGRGDADLRLGLELLLLSGGAALAAPVAALAPASARATATTTSSPAQSAPRAAAPAPAPAAAPATPPAPPATGEWGAMLASADPATKPLLADARPTLNGDTLVLSYPPTKSFLRQRAEAKRERIEALADKAYGRKIVIQFGELDPDTALREVWKE